jgi:ankyrin repeat protein
MDVENDLGQTPRQRALLPEGCHEIAEFLLERGAK